MINNIDALKNKIDDIEKILNYNFKNKNNIILALTHSSYANEKKNKGVWSNERLEFLGDAVLNIVTSETLYKEYPQLAEGEMTKARANIVCEQSLMKCANNLGIGDFLLLGKGEEMTGGRTRVSILSDAFEAIIAALYLDGGMERAKGFILSQLRDLMEDATGGFVDLDYKTKLQEEIQKNGDNQISYEIINEKGPDHNKLFVARVNIANRASGQGEGKSKKVAEQNAAKDALKKISSKT